MSHSIRLGPPLPDQTATPPARAPGQRALGRFSTGILSAVLAGLVGCQTTESATPPHAGAAPGTEALQLKLFATWPIETRWDAIPDPQAAWGETHEVWREAIDGAGQSLDLAFFYLSDDPEATPAAPSRLGPVIEAVEAAADRGVSVRVLADQGFEDTYPELLAAFDARARIEVRTLELPDEIGGVHHAKYLTVDGRTVITGSANFDWRSLEHVQELGARVDSPAVAGAYRAAFDIDWSLAGGEPRPDARALSDAFPVELDLGDGRLTRVTPLFSPPALLPDAALWDLPRLVELIDGAREELRLSALSFHLEERDGSRFEELAGALDRAAARGVEIHLIVADWNKRSSRIQELQELARRPGFQVSFLVIPDASSGFVPFSRVGHAKLVVADGTHAFLGSSNLSRGYFFESRNAGLLLEGAAAEDLAEFHRILESSAYAEPVDPGASYEPRRYRE